MMNDNSDLRRMFEAQRAIDEAAVPSFDDVHTQSLASVDLSVHSRFRISLPRVAAVLTVVAIVFGSLVIVLKRQNFPQRNNLNTAVAANDEMQGVNRACDALLATIDEAGPPTAAPIALPNDQEMQWPRGTESLLPPNSFAFSSRTSR